MMKKHFLILFLFVAYYSIGNTVTYGFTSQIKSASQSREVLPVNLRNQYVVQEYAFSPEQVEEYNRILLIIETKWKALKDQKTSSQNRSMGEISISKDLCNSVKKILSKEQYDCWYTNHKGHLKNRFYKEDLGLTDSQFIQFKQLAKTYSDKKASARQMSVSGTEEAELRKQAFEQYCTALHAILPSAVADYLIQENQVLNIASSISGKFTLIPETKAIQYAVLKMQYDKEMETLEAQTFDVKQKRKARLQIKEKFDSSLRGLFTDEEYIAVTKKRDWLTDKREMHTYRMSVTQLNEYKELKKRLAVQQLKIKQSKNEKSVKVTKLQAVEDEFEESLKKVMGEQQFDTWKKDQLARKNKKTGK